MTWADVTPGSGQGTHTMLLQVGEHTRLDGRTVNIVINGQSFRITQDPVGCVYTISPMALEIADQGGQLTFFLNTPVGCGWQAVASDSWISVRTPNGTGGGSIVLQIAPNTGDVRQGFVTIAGQRINITQRRG